MHLLSAKPFKAGLLAAATFLFFIQGKADDVRRQDGSVASSLELRVVLDENCPPFCQRDADGNLTGYLVDRWRLIEKASGLRIKITGCDWDMALRRMKAGEFDVIDTIFRTTDREEWLSFSQPHSRIEVCLFHERSITGIRDLSSIRDFPVAAKRGDFGLQLINMAGVRNLSAFPSYEAIMQAVIEHKVHVFIMDRPTGVHLLHRYGITGNFLCSEPVHVGEYHLAVRKGSEALLAKLEAATALVDKHELKQLEELWLGRKESDTANNGSLYFILIALLALGLALVLWNRRLRKQVRLRSEELQDSQVRFKQALESLPVAIGIADTRGKILTVNLEFQRRYGYTQQELPDIQTWLEKAYPERSYREAVLKLWNADLEEAIANNTATPARQYSIRAADGSVRPTELVVRPLGSLILTWFNDLSERKRLEEQMIQSRTMEAIGQLAGAVAHDFNNVLGSMLLNVTLLESETTGDGSAKTTMTDLRSGIERAAGLIRQLLIFGRKQEVEMHLLRLEEVLASQRELLQRILGDSIHLEFDFDKGLPEITGNRELIEQAVTSMALNAREAMNAVGLLQISLNKVTLNEAQLEGSEEARPGSYVRLGMQDNGCGMSAELLSHIFEPFFTTRKSVPGAGLGLALVYGIVRQHGAWIDVRSTEGKGSTFLIYFPYTQAKSVPRG